MSAEDDTYDEMKAWRPDPALPVNGTMQINATWTPPPYQNLNFTANPARCEISTKYVTHLAKSISSLETWPDVPSEYALNYTWSLLPSSARQNLTHAQLIAWYLTPDYWVQPNAADMLLPPSKRNASAPASVGTKMLQLPLLRCGKKICENLDWQGDSDITGVGMMISYYLVILLITLYFAMLLIARLPSVKRAAHKHKWVSRTVHSYTESTGTFLDSALVFAIAMLGAAITRYSSYLRNPDRSTTVYALFGSCFMSTFSIFPAVILQCVHRGLRKHHIRQFMWFLVIGLTIAVNILYRRVYKDRSWSTRPDDWEWTGIRENAQFGEFIWLRLCDPRAIRQELENLLTGAHIVLAINAGAWMLMWIGHIIFTMGFSKERRETWLARKDENKFLRRLCNARHAVMIINALFGLVVAWCMLVFFHNYRSEVTVISNRSNIDLNWTFGQVLALATWAPVLVDNTSIYFYGTTDGLTSSLPKGYKAVREDGRSDTDASSMGLDSEKTSGSTLPFVENQSPRPSGHHDERYAAMPTPQQVYVTYPEGQGSMPR